MKMLTGLLPASEGEALLFGQPLDASDLQSRSRVGYMSQSFSLYTELTVRQNLVLHARLFHLPPRKAKARIAELIEGFGLGDYVDQRALDLPLGIRQRLSLAVAVVHEPEILILDEPTSGVDPLARDRFWELLIDLSRNQGVTTFVSTHFMNEAERCDRISLMDSGRVLATDTPRSLVEARGAATLEDAFIGYLEEASGARAAATMTQTRSEARRRSGAAGHPAAGERRAIVQSATPLCLRNPRDAGANTRPNPGRFRVIRHDLPDARLWLRHLDRRQQSLIRRPRPRSEPRKQGLSRRNAGLALLCREGPARRLCGSRAAPRKRRYPRRHRDPARLWPRHCPWAARLGCCLGRWRKAVHCRDDPWLSRRACINCIWPIRR